MSRKYRVAFVVMFILILIIVAYVCLALKNQPNGILYKASQDPDNEAFYWSIHELLLTPSSDMESILSDYETKYREYVVSNQATYEDEESLQSIRPEWYGAVGNNGHEGYVNAIDLEWPDWRLPREEALELVELYRGQYRAIPVFDHDFTEILDYYLIGIR